MLSKLFQIRSNLIRQQVIISNNPTTSMFIPSIIELSSQINLMEKIINQAMDKKIVNYDANPNLRAMSMTINPSFEEEY